MHPLDLIKTRLQLQIKTSQISSQQNVSLNLYKVFLSVVRHMTTLSTRPRSTHTQHEVQQVHVDVAIYNVSTLSSPSLSGVLQWRVRLCRQNDEKRGRLLALQGSPAAHSCRNTETCCQVFIIRAAQATVHVRKRQTDSFGERVEEIFIKFHVVD